MTDKYEEFKEWMNHKKPISNNLMIHLIKEFEEYYKEKHQKEYMKIMCEAITEIEYSADGNHILLAEKVYNELKEKDLIK